MFRFTSVVGSRTRWPPWSECQEQKLEEFLFFVSFNRSRLQFWLLSITFSFSLSSLKEQSGSESCTLPRRFFLLLSWLAGLSDHSVLIAAAAADVDVLLLMWRLAVRSHDGTR